LRTGFRERKQHRALSSGLDLACAGTLNIEVQNQAFEIEILTIQKPQLQNEAKIIANKHQEIKICIPIEVPIPTFKNKKKRRRGAK
jgi:hypothetical protein